MNFLLDRISRLRPCDILPVFKLALTYIPGKLYKHRHPDVWIVSEYPEDARDNGYWLFHYLRKEHPEKEVYYPIRKRASDYPKISVLGNVIEFGGWKHYLLFWAASKYMGTTQYSGFPWERICGGLFEMRLTGFQYIFLNHGFARGVSSIVKKERTRYAMIMAMSDLEKEIIVKMNGQDPKIIEPIGFCRHDNLYEGEKEDGLIVVMPTWRHWLDYRHETNEKVIASIQKEFKQSLYFKEFDRMLNDPEFLQILEDYNLKMIFYLHGYAQSYAPFFHSASERVIIAKKEEYYVQDLLKRAAFLVTDYSSVSCDYVYMKKPMVYFQFDGEKFAKEQYPESEYFTYKDNGFGPVAHTLEEVETEIVDACKNQFRMKEKYEKRTNEFFKNFGHDHCERTYQLIEKL